MEIATFKGLLKQLYANKAQIKSPFDPQISTINHLTLEAFRGLSEIDQVAIIEAYGQIEEAPTLPEVSPGTETPSNEKPPDRATIAQERIYALVMVVIRSWIVRLVVVLIGSVAFMVTGMWIWSEFSQENSWLHNVLTTFKKMVKIWM